PPPFEPHRLVCRNKAVYPFVKTAKHDSPAFMDKSRLIRPYRGILYIITSATYAGRSEPNKTM
ncbi:MAG TPA: hypothetical protein PKW53_11745, partial [Syntrophorhabdus sp.]|nr:hypothetical protein [Syntrophorhabdus sp.]